MIVRMLTIEIVSDVVCPWCFIGTRRLEAAVAMVRKDIPEFRYRARWRPFFLNPDTPPEGEPYLPFLERKFGGRDQVEALFERVRAAGRPYGLEYAFEKIRLRANTLRAHRLIHWVQEKGDASTLVKQLFIAQFQRGEHVGDPRILVAIAAECGYDPVAVEEYLNLSRDEDVIWAEEREARERGIRQVPTFILNGKQIVVGAEDPAMLADAIRQALQPG